MPPDAPQWLRSLIADCSVAGASEAFWNKVEAFEKRSDAQLAKDITIALPLELSAEQNIALVRDFVERHILARGMVADWVYHDAPGNPHVHLMMTLRPLTEDGFGSKKVAVMGENGEVLRTKTGKIVYELWAGGIDDFTALRDAWFEIQNQHLALGGVEPASLGALKGRTGLLASKADKEARRVAEVNVPALKRDIERYLQMRAVAAERIEKEEQAHRHRLSIEIPALSPAARSVLETIREAIDRNDLPAALAHIRDNREVRLEIDGFNRAIAERFGERTLLGKAAREPSGALFDKAAEGLRPVEREKLRQAWPVMRAAQQIAAHERTTQTLTQVEQLRLAQRQGLAWKL